MARFYTTHKTVIHSLASKDDINVTVQTCPGVKRAQTRVGEANNSLIQGTN